LRPPSRLAIRALLLAGSFLFFNPAYAAAEWQFAPFVGYTFKGATTLVDLERGSEDTHWHFGGTATLIGRSPFGVEALFLYTPGFFQSSDSACSIATCVTVSSSRTYALMGNAVLATPRGWNQYGLRPYVSGGIGLLHASRKEAQNVIPFDLNLLGMNAGGGAVGFLSDRVGLRFDLRYFRKIQGPAAEDLDFAISIGPIRLRQWTTSLGVVIKY
jgi:hypothetical protein